MSWVFRGEGWRTPPIGDVGDGFDMMGAAYDLGADADGHDLHAGTAEKIQRTECLDFLEAFS